MEIKEGVMMDIQKEREAFELNVSPVIWERIEYNAENNIYMAKSKYWASTIVQAAANEIDFGWKMWQLAEAQAVPEGYVLVPVTPSDEFIDKLADVICNEFDTTISGSAHCATEAYKLMIEAQEPANEN